VVDVDDKHPIILPLFTNLKKFIGFQHVSIQGGVQDFFHRQYQTWLEHHQTSMNG
jgi:hypothetical protein